VINLRILVTRAEEDCAELEALLRERGATPVRMPCIAFEDLPLDAKPADFDLIVVSSPHAARRLLALFGRDLSKTRLAAVGAATAAALGSDAVERPDEGGGAEALLHKLRGSVRGLRVLLPRAERGTEALSRGLRDDGALVDERVLYKTITPATGTLPEGRIDCITFASGSAVRGFLQIAGAKAASRSAIACLGRSARDAAEEAGLDVDWSGSGERLRELCDGAALAVARRNDYSEPR
jgi:uroporphyrinogen III methyltransferase/synthase